MLNKTNHKWSYMCEVTFALVLLLFCQTLFAKQTSFSQKRGIQSTDFAYEWRVDEARYRLSFSLDNEEMALMPDSPPRYNQRVFQDVVYAKVIHEAKRIDAKMANVKVLKNTNGLSFKVRGRNPQEAQRTLDRLKEAHSKAQQEYWTENFFTQYQSPTGETSLRHDHSRYTQYSKDPLKAVVSAIKDMQQNNRDSREFVSILLSWIQSIPYNTLQNRIESNGAGFISPRDLLVHNQGDCDSKSTLMASILKAYNPNIDIQMLYLPNHALLAVAMRAQKSDQSVKIAGIDYVLIEPTGPAQYNIGEADETSLLAIRNRQYDLKRL